MEEERWSVTYTKDVNRKRNQRQKVRLVSSRATLHQELTSGAQGGVVVVRNGRASLFDCPEEDGRVFGAPVAFSGSGGGIVEGEERTFEEGNVIVYFDHVVLPTTDAAAPAAARPPAQPVSRGPTTTLPFPPSKFRAPATLPPRTAAAPHVPVRPQLDLQPSSATAPLLPSVEHQMPAAGAPSPAHAVAAAARAGKPLAPLLSDEELLAQIEGWNSGDEAPHAAVANESTAHAAVVKPIAAAVLEEWDDFDAPEAADMELSAEAPPAVAVAPPQCVAAGAFRAPAAIARPAAAAAAVQRPAARFTEGCALQLRFPTPRETPLLKLTAAVPLTFPTAEAYSASLVAALGEFLQVQLNGCARAFYGALAAAASPRDVPSIKRAAQQGRLCLYAGAELSMRPPSSTAPTGKRGRDEVEEAKERSGGASSAPTYFLKLTAAGEREKASDYAKGDLWVLSSEATMDCGPQGWSAIVASLWHGPSPEGVLAVRLLSPAPPSLTKHRRSLPAFAMRCFNVSGELDQLQAALDVASCSVARLPCLPLLLHAPPSAPPATGLDLRCVELQHRYTLNEDQACMVQAAETCALADAPRALLVQGPFGCGKTHTLAALVRHLCATLDAQRSTKRILVAGFTNACVDGLLCTLLDNGFTDFVRVGSLRRIALRVLPYAVGSKSSSKSSDERDLKALLATAATPAARAAVERELAALAAGRMAARVRRLSTCRVCAVTTASCTQERLISQKFDIVLIDEACQLNEPSALLPLVRFGARCCIFVGDQAQLPPLLINVDQCCDDGIQRPLFLRLLAGGHAPLLLRTQYRCHPQLSALPNALYYDGRLLDGVSAAERLPLLPSLPPLTVLDVTCGSSRTADAELHVASRLVQTLLTCGVPPESIAVLCFLNMHVATIQRSLAVRADETTGDGVLTVSSIDAFQGQEREIIILVASGMQPGFATPQRVNVALSRARRHLLCICRSASSCQGTPWLDKLLRASRPVPRSYLRLADPRAPLPRWHEASAPPQLHASQPLSPSPAAALVDVPPAPSPSSVPEDAAALHRRTDDASPMPSGSAPISVDADDEDILELSDGVEAPAADEASVPYLCSPEAEAMFAACAFDSRDLWTGYKLFHFHSYAKKPANAERAAFFATKLGKVCQKLCAVKSRQLLQNPFVRTYVMAKAYVARHGADGAHGVRLATLLERHEDMAALRREHPAFAWHVEKDAADEDDDDDEPNAKAPRAETGAAGPPAAPAEEFIDLSGTPASPAREAEPAELSVDDYLF